MHGMLISGGWPRASSVGRVECVLTRCCLNAYMDGRMPGGLDARADLEPWTDGWMDGWMGGWVDGWMDGWMDGFFFSPVAPRNKPQSAPQ